MRIPDATASCMRMSSCFIDAFFSSVFTRIALGVFVSTRLLYAQDAPPIAGENTQVPVGVTAAVETKKANTPTEKSPLKFGMFVDTYYSASIIRPASNDRQFLTQAARDREFNINLAYLDATYETERVRGRMALQFGTSVNANYQNEPLQGAGTNYSNQFSTRNIQEAYAGYKLFGKVWLDAGIFFGNIGMENWISHNNYNYTRALNLDNVPYYSSGLRLAWEATQKLSFQLHILNGWQVITPPNRDKSLGTQISYDATAKFKIIHNTFAGNVAPDDGAPAYRFYSNLILQYSPLSFLQLALTTDVGAQKNRYDNGYRQWYAGALYARWLFAREWAAALRFEYFVDPGQVMIQTGTTDGFQTVGFTTNIDYMPEDAYRLRFEYRNFFNKDAVYQQTGGTSAQEHMVTFGASLKL